MHVSRRHVLAQGPVVRALVETAVLAARNVGAAPPELPGPKLRAQLPARSDRLIRDYVRHLGGDPAWYRGTVPAHLFSQWGFPLLARTLRAVPYDLRKVLNGGCRIEVHRPLPAGERLQLEAQLESIDDNGSRAVIANHLVTGTASAPRAVDAWMYAVVPLSKEKGDKKKERPTVPVDAREIARWRLTPADAVDFAVLTGDVNPVHWLRPYAKAAGFRSTILHGFATLGRAVEGLNRARFAGEARRLAAIDVKFTRPLLLPADVGLYVRDHELFVGTAAGGPAFLTGTFEERDDG
ncbi:MAG: MaoC/PaaZ C-terminal domain-containing protein [Myxococcota bacterium]